MTLDDVPALAVVALCLRELRGVRMGLELALAQLRGDLRAVLGLLTSQRGGGGLELPTGGAPSGLGDGPGDERQGVEDARDRVEERPRVQDEPGAAGMAQGAEAIGLVGHGRRLSAAGR